MKNMRNTAGKMLAAFLLILMIVMLPAFSGAAGDARAETVRRLELNDSYICLYTRQSEKLTASMDGEGSISEGLVWMSSDDAIASVSVDGTVTGCGKGITLITAFMEENPDIAASCIVHVYPENTVETIELDCGSKKLSLNDPGNRFALHEKLAPADADAMVLWKSDDPDVAVVSGGTVTAVGEGSAVITAYIPGGPSASCTVEVVQSFVALTLPESLQIIEDEAFTGIAAEQIKINESVEKIGNGAFSGCKSLLFVSIPDSVTEIADDAFENDPLLTIVCSFGSTAYHFAEAHDIPCYYEAVEEPRIIRELNMQSALSVPVNDYERIEYSVYPLFGTDARLEWSSSDASIAAVNEVGVVVGVKPGSCVVTGRTIDGSDLSAECAVTVIPVPDGISLNMSSLNLVKGENVRIPYTLEHSGEIFCDEVLILSDNEDIVAVENDGTITAAGEGSTCVTLATCNGYTASCRVNVLPEGENAPCGFGWDHAYLIDGTATDAELSMNSAALNGEFDVISTDEAVVAVNAADGCWTISAVGEGTADIVFSAGGVDLCRATLEVISAAEVQFAYDGVKMDSTLIMQNGSTKVVGYECVWPEENLLNSIVFDCADELLTVETAADEEKPCAGALTLIASNETGESDISFYGAEQFGVKVKKAEYRAVLIGEFSQSGVSGYLPFVNNNMETVSRALAQSSVDGEGYQILASIKDKDQGDIFAAIAQLRNAACEFDVSFIYIVAHGHYTSGVYDFTTTNNQPKTNLPETRVNSEELWSMISQIPGNVVLVLDTCHSGGFIDNCKDRIGAVGNVSVLTAQGDADLTASYFAGASSATNVEFLTYSFCEGIGIREYDTGARKQFAPCALYAAEADASRVTVAEAFDYAKVNTPLVIKDKIKNYKSSVVVAGYSAGTIPSGWTQYPNYLLSENASSLILVGR